MRAAALVIAGVLLAAGGVARADSPWDGTYKESSVGGGELCPHVADGSTLVVKDGAFSLPWNIRAGNDALVRVGTIEGTVRPSGMATATAKLLEPMPAAAVAALEQMDDSVAKLRPMAKAFAVSFKSYHNRQLALGTNPDCGATWESAGTVKPMKAEAPPPIAVKLPPGAPAWDGAYLVQSGYREDWRCPHESGMPVGKYGAEVRVSKGHFAFPYIVVASDRYGHDYGEVTLGQVDGSVAANGKVTLKTTLTITELPPELTRDHAKSKDDDDDDQDAAPITLEAARTLMATATMSFAKGQGAEKTGVFEIGHKCDMHLVTSATFRPGSSVSAPAKKSNGAHCKRDNECASDNCDADRCVAPSSPD